ncbi:serine acetyltransferase [Arthrobacter sp. JZ12]|nr:serine acetyltransferase [Arthrobacter sp. JZ12]
MSMRQFVNEDAARLIGAPSPANRKILLFLTSAAFATAVLHRLSHMLQTWHPGLARLVSAMNLRLHGADIDPRAVIGPGVLFQHPVGVTVGGGVRLGSGCTLMGGVTLGRKQVSGGPDEDQYPKVGTGVMLGAHSCLLGDIEVGDHSVVAAQALLLMDVPRTAWQ